MPPDAGDHVPEPVGGEFPAGLRLAYVVREGDRAPQALVRTGAACQQGITSSGPCCRPLPGELAARGLQAQHVLGRPAHRGPHRGGERLVAGDTQLMPYADRGVGNLVALRRGIGDRARGGRLRP